MRKATQKAIRDHAVVAFPFEACGLIVAAGRKEIYVPCRNTSTNPEQFILPAEDYAAAEDRGRIIGVVHSHVNIPARPSEADLVACEASGLPWHIVQVTDEAGEVVAGEVYSFEPSGYEAPLVGRQFFHGSLDCYGLVRDYFRIERDIEVPDFERPDKWWDGDEELYLDNFTKAGFEQVRDGSLRSGDVILMQYRSQRTNHGGVFLGSDVLRSMPDLHPVPDAMLHHAMPNLSERVPYGGHWQDITRMIVRHRDL